jgi:hypothetical protein
MLKHLNELNAFLKDQCPQFSACERRLAGLIFTGASPPATGKMTLVAFVMCGNISYLKSSNLANGRGAEITSSRWTGDLGRISGQHLTFWLYITAKIIVHSGTTWKTIIIKIEMGDKDNKIPVASEWSQNVKLIIIRRRKCCKLTPGHKTSMYRTNKKYKTAEFINKLDTSIQETEDFEIELE